MTRNNRTKRALLVSGLALLLCISMLIGSTFAWFTDSVTSAGNKIQSGTLKVDLELLDKASGVWASLKEDGDPVFTYEKWEPGYVDTKVFKVENEGNLALQWKAKFIAAGELSILADVIDVYVCEGAEAYPAGRDLAGYTRKGTLREFLSTLEEASHGTLTPMGTADAISYFGIALKMQESAGNDYQDKTIGAFDIQIVATQFTYEEDSFDNTYDEDADRESNISASSKSDLQDAFDDAKDGDVITLSNDVDVADGIVLNSDAEVTLDLGGFTLIGNADVLLDVAAGNVVIQNGTIQNKNTNTRTSRTVAPDTLVSVRLSADTVAEIKNVTIETTGIGILLEDNAKVIELNATVKSYVTANGNCDGSAISLVGDNARIDLISGGEYVSTYTDEFIDAYSGSFSGLAIYPLSINNATASVGEISGGTFLGRADDGRNGATIFVNAGKIEKISGGYFGFCKYTLRNYPYFIITVNTANGASIDAITGGTFEYASGFGCDFANIVDQSGSKIEVRDEKLTVSVKFSTSVKTKEVSIWDVVSK